MRPPDPATAAFIRYSRRELDALSGPIEAGCEHVAGCGGNSAPQIILATLRTIAGYFVRMAGAMNEPTSAFWREVNEFFESQPGASPVNREKDRNFFAKILEAKRPSQLFDTGAMELSVLHAIGFYDRENNTAYLHRAKMFFWRFAEALVAADLEGTLDEEAALDQFKKVLDAETDSGPDASGRAN